MIDYHLHTSRCCHAIGTLEEYLAEAMEKGLKEIGFADHFPLGLLDYTPRAPVTMNPGELEEYIDEVEALKSSTTAIKIKLGIEVDYLPGTEEKLEQLLKQYPFDFVIGSIHFMHDWDFTHPVYADTYKDRNIAELYRYYFDLVSKLCKSGLFDIIGHLDVIKKFGYRPENDLKSLWCEIAEVMKKSGICFELNTAGRDAPVGDFYPDRGLLEICRKKNIPVTLGSDAHSPDQVGRYFPEAVSLLQSVGYSELTVFNQRATAVMDV
ncbi:MAG: histidinol-phosphatase HisJ family protein [Dethiobacteria bacterium]|nr:histidinol-phosphatase HisJ family protein [Bacillota bacterium]